MVEVFKTGKISKSSNPAGVLYVNFQSIQEEFVAETLYEIKFDNKATKLAIAPMCSSVQ